MSTFKLVGDAAEAMTANGADAHPIVDTHVHWWMLLPADEGPETDRLNFFFGAAEGRWPLPWLQDEANVFLNKDMPPAAYEAAVAGTGITKAIFVETNAPPEHRNVEAAAALAACHTGGLFCGAIIGCAINDAPAEFEQYMDAFAGDAALKGVRQVLFIQPPGYCRTEAAVANVKLLGERGLIFELLTMPEHLDDALWLAEQAPGTTFVLEHCAGHQGLRGTNGDPGGPPPDAEQRAAWERGVAALAQKPNVVAKVSALYGGWSGGLLRHGVTWSVDLQKETMLTVLRAFPSDRILFGTDWPVCEGSAPVTEYVAATRSLVEAEVGVESARALFCDNALRVYKL